LRTLINRPVLMFYRADGSTATYAPGLAGRSMLTVTLNEAAGRALPPVYIRGSYCDRAQSDTDTPDAAVTAAPKTGAGTTP